MGMYTVVIHPETKEEIQIKCGGDWCDKYEVGDEVPFKIHPDCSMMADFADGIYVGLGERNDFKSFNSYYVVICEGKIAEVSEKYHSMDSRAGYEREELYNKYKDRFIELEKSWWSDEAWKKDEELKKELEIKRKEYLDRHHPNYEKYSDEEKFTANVVHAMSASRLNYQEIGKKLMSIQELPQGALARYEKDVASVHHVVGKREENENKN